MNRIDCLDTLVVSAHVLVRQWPSPNGTSNIHIQRVYCGVLPPAFDYLVHT